MNDFLSELNTWIMDHQALVVAVGLPLLTAIASGVVGFITTSANLRSVEKDRALQRRIRLFNEQKERIDQLRAAVRRYEAANFILAADFRFGLTSGIERSIPKARVKEILEQTISIMIEIILLVESSDPDARALNDALNHQMLDFSLDQDSPSDEAISKKFFPVCQRIIGRMETDARKLLAT